MSGAAWQRCWLGRVLGSAPGWGLQLLPREGMSHTRDMTWVLPRSRSPGQARAWETIGGVPTSIGRSDPIPASLQPSRRAGHLGRVWMWHLERNGTVFCRDTCAPRQLPRGVGDCLAGKRLTPGEFQGAGESPAGYTQAASHTDDLTPLPWQRLMKSPVPRAGRPPRAWGDGMGAWEAAERRPPNSHRNPPGPPRMSCAPRQR